MKFHPFFILLAFGLIGCGEQGTTEQSAQAEESIDHTETFVNDPHSFSNPHEAVTKHLDLKINVDFDAQVVSGVASYRIAKKSNADRIVFDIDSLEIEKITLNNDETGAIYSIGKGNAFGQTLAVNIHKNTRRVNIHYRTKPSSSAVQWLTPEQTLGKKHPYLFTQGQAILTRSWIPCQDSPGVRLTYNAEVTVPEGLMAVMSARNPKEPNSSGKYSFEMVQPIPPYLIALAVGDIAFQSVSDNMGVYAEPKVLEAAAYEFDDMPRMMEATERLYGPYRWERYDLIVLPPSFPFGGMENPRLTFATPTIIAGDRSLTALVAHELAHSWSGNLVTNATWNDFWLNEGFTVYIEKRIMEELYGEGYKEMLNLLDYKSLVETVEKLGEGSPLTSLKLDLEGMDPDEGMTDIAYEKGYNFLKVIEVAVGRERFDTFLKNYFDHFAFGSVTTEVFLGYLQSELLAEGEYNIDIQEWVYGTGLPADIVVPESDRFDEVLVQMNNWLNGNIALHDLDTRQWSTHEWLHFIRSLPQDIGMDKLSAIDQQMAFSLSRNAEIQAAWFVTAIDRNYTNFEMDEALENFLHQVGRRKFLMPIYTALSKTEKGKEKASMIYAQARKNYHSVSVRSIDELLDFDPKKYKGSISL